MSILVVDDDEPMRRYIDRVLSAAGYSTTLAVDGADAIGAVARGGPFDLLLSDVVMPQMTAPRSRCGCVRTIRISRCCI
jgi:two-component system cell cycle sensor histidine kinase/response regulator CckA